MAESCPNCGAAVPDLLATARVQACDFCGTTLVKADSVLTSAGTAGEMFDAPGLFHLGQPADIGGTHFTPQGHLRYDYGRGFWDEYWGEDGTGAPLWVSVDEGDVAVQKPLMKSAWPTANPFRLGASIRVMDDVYTVTEVNTATCVGFRGQLPEAPEIGESHMFANLAGHGTRLLSAERWGNGASDPNGGEAWFVGRWVDPFEVAAL